MRTLAATTAVGLVLGLVVGGVGSRLAMRVLFLTSGPGVRGLVSDDGFRIGQFSPAATLNLLVLCTIVGVIGAFVYLAVRPFLLGPQWLRATTCGLAGGAVVGSLIVHDDGVDFTLLRPTWLAVALFVAVPALFGLLAAPAVEWAARPDGWFLRTPTRWALLPLVVFLFPPLLLLVGVPAALVVGGGALLDRSPVWSAALRGGAFAWAMRALWLAAALAGVAALSRDIASLG